MARASETEKGRPWAENRIKNLTGEDKITVNFMRQDHFEFQPQCKFTIFGNNRPSLQNVDDAFRRRFNVLPFLNKPKRVDPNLGDKLRTEWSAILSWAIQGCLDWQANGLLHPDVVREATAEYFAEQDVFQQWLNDCCDIGKKFEDTTKRLWQSWSSYAEGEGERPGSKTRTFPETLQQRGFVAAEKVGSARARGYRGLRIKATAPTAQHKEFADEDMVKGDDEGFSLI
jgi:putative DNA primase/helicase